MILIKMTPLPKMIVNINKYRNDPRKSEMTIVWRYIIVVYIMTFIDDEHKTREDV